MPILYNKEMSYVLYCPTCIMLSYAWYFVGHRGIRGTHVTCLIVAFRQDRRTRGAYASLVYMLLLFREALTWASSFLLSLSSCCSLP